MKLMHKNVLPAVAMLIALPACGSGSDSSININEGQWEMSFTTSMGGMTIPAITTQQCITKQDLVPQQAADENSDCGPTEIKYDGNTVSWTVDCQQSRGTGKVTYSGDTMKGEMMISTQAGGMTMDMTSTITGKRLGDCKD